MKFPEPMHVDLINIGKILREPERDLKDPACISWDRESGRLNSTSRVPCMVPGLKIAK